MPAPFVRIGLRHGVARQRQTGIERPVPDEIDGGAQARDLGSADRRSARRSAPRARARRQRREIVEQRCASSPAIARRRFRQRLAGQLAPARRQQQRPRRPAPAGQTRISAEAAGLPCLDHARQHFADVAIQIYKVRLGKHAREERNAQRILRRLFQHAQRKRRRGSPSRSIRAARKRSRSSAAISAVAAPASRRFDSKPRAAGCSASCLRSGRGSRRRSCRRLAPGPASRTAGSSRSAAARR